MLNPAYEIRLVKENLDLSMSLMRAVQEEEVTAKQIFGDGPQELFIGFAVDRHGPDQEELTRRAANQARAAFSLAVLQTQRSLERVFANNPINEENPDLQAARCIMFLLYNTVAPDLFTPVWDCPAEYRRSFEVRPINLVMNAGELHGTGLSWDHVGGLPQFLDLLGYFANVIDDLPELYQTVDPVPDLSTPATSSEPSGPLDESDRPPVQSPIQTTVEDLAAPLEVSATPAPAETVDGQVARFVAERCDLGGHNRATAKELYAGFQEWCLETGQDDVSQRSFGMQLTTMGLYRRRRGRGKHWWEGIRLTQSVEKMSGGALELTNGHYKGYQTELPS